VPGALSRQRSSVPFLAHDDDSLRVPVYQAIGPTIATLGAAAGSAFR
jgi:hypothetical protein